MANTPGRDDRANDSQTEYLERSYQRIRQQLYNFAHSRLQNHEAAEDALGEMFLRIKTYQHTFTSKESVQGWLFRILANVIHDEWSEYNKQERRTEPLNENAEAVGVMMKRPMIEGLFGAMRDMRQVDSVDLEMLRMRLSGMTHEAIRAELRMGSTAYWLRWPEIRTACVNSLSMLRRREPHTEFDFEDLDEWLSICERESVETKE